MHVADGLDAIFDFNQRAGEFFAQATNVTAKAFDGLAEFLALPRKLGLHVGIGLVVFADLLNSQLVFLALVAQQAAQFVDLALQMTHLRLGTRAIALFFVLGTNI